MRKYLMSLAVLMAGAAVFTACSKDDNDAPNVEPTPVSEGIFVVNSGNMYSGIAGSLTSYDIATGQSVQNIFASANGRELGSTPNDGVFYGSKLYIVVDGENRIEVLDAKTLKAGTPISTTALLGDQEGVSPRHIVAANGCIYVSTYGNVVAAIDTTDYSLKAKYAVGPYPEGMAYEPNTRRLYVANSAYGTGVDASLCYIDIDSGNVSFFTNDLIKNPSTLALVNGALYVMEGDVYDWETWEVVSAGGLRRVKSNQVERVIDGSMAMGANQMAVSGNLIYMIKDAYTAPTGVVYDTATGVATDLPLADLVAANAIGVDPVTGDITVLSYSANPEVTEYTAADYNAPGYANIYAANGTKKGSFATGVGPTAIVYKTGVVYE